MWAIPTSRRRSAKAAFEAIAPVYDDLTADRDIEGWLKEVMPEIESHGLTGHRLLDVACGTGGSMMPMLARDWEVAGYDISPAMIARARAKLGAPARLFVADVLEMPVFGAFNLVWALSNTLNYLLSLSELRTALGGMRRNLDAGGMVLFDLNTLLSYRTVFAETQTVEGEGRQMIWRGQAEPDAQPGSICDAYFEADGPRMSDEVRAHIHRQRHFPTDDVMTTITRAGLCCLGAFGQGEDAVLHWPLDESAHPKALYIAVASRSILAQSA